MYVNDPTTWNTSGATFVDNHARDTGGGISLRTENFHEDAFLDGCLFVSNGAGDGGALFQESRYAKFEVSSSVFRQNYAGEKVAQTRDLGRA